MAISAASALMCVGSAGAQPPTLSSVANQDRHLSATFAAPFSDFAAMYVASKPDRATDGSFLMENVKEIDILTDSEIQSGRWLSESQIDPGTYWVMLKALPDFERCYRDLGDFDPACADGYSNVVQVVVPKPSTRYATKVTVYRSLRQASLTLIATLLGEKLPYRVCYRLRNRVTRCLAGVVSGYDWSSPASDQLTVNTRNLPTLAKFTWYVGGKAVASKRIRVR